MKFLYLWLFSLKVLRVLSHHQPHHHPYNGEEHVGNEVEVVDYNAMGRGTCPKIKQPLCATNGEEVLYFDNKCLLEVRNFEQLMQGLKEYFECPLSYCGPQCAPCGEIYEPVCAVDVLTGKMENFPNSCEVERKICFTQREHRIMSSGQCPSTPSPHSKCPQFCTLEFMPVCAQFQTELRQFPNQCQLDKEKCETNKDWHTVDPSYCVENTAVSPLKFAAQETECPEFCTLEYQPICARFMTLEKEFSNECELKTTICQTKQKWDIIRRGPCQEAKVDMASGLIAPIRKCPEFCTLEYDPICAKFENELREFANKCELETTKCRTSEDWQIIEHGPCPSVSNTKAFKLKQKPKCPQFCTLEYRPICAQFEEELREFGNKCELEVTICESGQDWQIVRDGPCSSSPTEFNLKTAKLSQKLKCPQFCTLEYSPICAQLNNELREFSNKCDLESTICLTNQKWEIVHQGTCDSDPVSKKPKCPQVCTAEYRPICAQFENELREFSNNCDLARTICETNRKWQIVKEGTCFVDSSAEISECPKFCTKEYRPVCAEFKGEEREFANKCVLLQAICESNKKWELVKLGPCSRPTPKLFKISTPKCPKFCSREFDPVCAKLNNDLREFSNKCVLDTWNCETNEKWELISLGPCPSIKPASALLSSATECPKFCTREFDPVCAKLNNEMTEFSNKCVLDAWNCESEEKWELVSKGPCPSIKPASALLSSAKFGKKQTPKPLVSCPKFCTKEYNPVCAKSDQELREFSNRCELLRENCETKTPWVFQNSGPCSSPLSAKKLTLAPLTPPCPQFCTDDLRPVCAEFNSELREFGNRCEMQVTICQTKNKWKVVNEGPCPSIKPTSSSLLSSSSFGKTLTPKPLVSCPKFCTKEYNPVCAKFDQELREFSNPCELLRENCETNTPWVFQNSGPCTSAISAKKLTLAPLTPPCPEFCTDDLRPVCAEFNSELREFGNRCEMQVTICQTKNKWKVVNEGPCSAKSKLKPACPKFCTKEFSPVCARFKGQLREFPNKCEFQRSLCETNIAWELINNGPCLIKNFETDSIELKPICATDGKINKMFNDPSELQEDIRKTGVAWSLLHNDECLTPPLPLAKMANKAFFLATERSSTKSTTTTTTPKTTTTTTSKTTSKPKTTTSTTPKFSTTKKTTPKHSTTIKPRTTSAKTSTTAKPQHTTTSKTITATTTTPKTTTTVKPSTPKTATTNYPRYSPTPSSSIDPHNQCSYDHSTEIDSAEIDDSSKGYHEHDDYCGCGGQEDFEAYSEESFSDEDYISWEDDDDEDDDVLEEDEEDTSQSSEVQGSYTIDNNSYTYKHNKSNSTYTFIYGKGLTNSDSERNDIGKKGSEKMGNNEDKKNSEIKKQSNSAEPKGKQGISSKHNLKSAPIKNVKDSLTTGNLKTVPNTKLGNSKTNVQNSVKKVDSSIQKSNQEDLKLLGDEEGINIVELIQERLREEDHDMTKQKPDSLPNGNLKTFTDKNIKLENKNRQNNLKSNRQDLKLLRDEKGINLVELLQERLVEEFESQEDREKPKPTPSNKGSLKNKQNPNPEDLKLLGDEDGINLVELLQERLGEEFESQEDHEKPKPTQSHKGSLKTKQRDQIKPNLAKTKLNSKTKDQVQIKPKLGKADLHLNIEPKLNTNSPLYFPESNEDVEESDEEHYGNLAQPNLNLSTEQQQFQIIRNHGQSELNSDTDLYIPQISRNLLDNTNLEQPKLDANSALYSPEYYEGPKDIVEDTFADVLGNFYDKDQSLEANISSEEEAQQETTHSFGPVSLSEKQPKFGVYSDEAYGLMEWSMKNQPKETEHNEGTRASEIDANKDFHTLLSDPNYNEDKVSEQNEELPEYSTQPQMNSTENAENILEVFEALLSESDAEEEDDETLVKQVLTTIGSETTATYPSFEDMDTQSNYTKREEYPAKYNSTYSKKGEIYNGAVFKAPVYDAPTYNFIYTAPNHPVLPLMPPNHHPFLNYPGFRPQYTDPVGNPYNSFVPLGNQTNFGIPKETGSSPNNPYNPLHFLTSLAAMGSPLGSSMPNLMPLPHASEYYSNNLPQNQDNPLNLEEPPSQDSLNPSSPAVFNKILPQTHPSPHMFLPPPPEPFLNSFSPLANIASQIPNALPLSENREPSEENNSPNAEGNETELPQYPYPAPPLPIYNNPVNPQMQQPLPLLPSMASNALPNLPYQPMPYPYPAAPLALPPPAGSLPLNIFNATLFHQIAETLKTIISRY